MKICRNVPVSKNGFTLIELLAVMVIIAALSGLSVMSLRSLSSNSSANMNVTTLGGLIDRTRQHAIAFNTRAWIGFASSENPKGIYVAIISTRDGTNPFSTQNTQDMTLNASLQLVTKVAFLQSLQLVSSQDLSSSMPGLPDFSTEAVAPTDLQGLIGANYGSFSLKIPAQNSQTVFTHLIEFTPTGHIEVNSCIPSQLLIGLKPNAPQASDAMNSTVFALDGLSGQTKIYRR